MLVTDYEDLAIGSAGRLLEWIHTGRTRSVDRE